MILTVAFDTFPVNGESLQGALMAPKASDVLSPMQCRAARAALRMTLQQLADHAAVSKITVLRFENEKVIPNPGTMRLIRKALEAAGIAFPDPETMKFPPLGIIREPDADDEED